MHNKFTNPLGGVLFALPFFSLVTDRGVGLCSFIFLLAGLACLGKVRAALTPEAGWVVAAFLFNFLVSASFCLIRPDVIINSIEKPGRMLLAASALVLVLALRPSRLFLWWGVAGGAMAGALLVGYQRLVLGIDRPGGLVNPITAGGFLMCMSLLSLAALPDVRRARDTAWLAAGALAGFAGSFITGTRGSALALLPALLVLARYRRAPGGRRVRIGMAAALALAAAAVLVPQTGVRKRIDQGVRDVTAFVNGGSVNTHVGLRLELWRAAGMLIGERPLAGAGPATVKAEMAGHARAGAIDPVVLAQVHFHNDALQAMVFRGLPGLAGWLAILLAPLAFFERAAARDGECLVPALAGMLMVASYFAFGLTEVIFWTHRASMFYALMVFVLMGLCLNAQSGGKGAHCARMLP